MTRPAPGEESQASQEFQEGTGSREAGPLGGNRGAAGRVHQGRLPGAGPLDRSHACAGAPLGLRSRYSRHVGGASPAPRDTSRQLGLYRWHQDPSAERPAHPPPGVRLRWVLPPGPVLQPRTVERHRPRGPHPTAPQLSWPSRRLVATPGTTSQPPTSVPAACAGLSLPPEHLGPSHPSCI